MKEENWIEIQVWTNKESEETRQNNIAFMMLSKMIVDKVREHLDTYHHFYEPDPHFLVRLKPKYAKKIPFIKKEVEKVLKEFKAATLMPKYVKPWQQDIRWKFVKYIGEEARFGELPWPAVSRFFQATTDIAHKKSLIYYHDLEKMDGELFRDEKLVHCYLNHQGYGSVQELDFYQKCYRNWLLQNIYTKLKSLFVEKKR